MYPKSIDISSLDKNLIVVENINQFRKEDGTRRIGIQFWLACREKLPSLEGSGVGDAFILIHYTLDQHSDTKWLMAMVQEQRVYLTKDTHLLTLAVAKTLKPIEP
ncbi:MAG: hypothetical protein ABJG41_01470 [Cyclobacteriaceae bacterium]